MKSAVLVMVVLASGLTTVGCRKVGAAAEEASRSRAEGYGAVEVQDESGIVAELNGMRAAPAAYAAKLEARRGFYAGRLLRVPGQIAIRTEEGVSALDEAVAALRAAPALPLLSGSGALTRSARDHVRDIGPKGLFAHEGSDGSSPRDRMSRYVTRLSSTAEVISFGPQDAVSVVMDLLVDDGVPSRGHRKILLDPTYRVAGAACGSHATYRFVCVVDLAGAEKAPRPR